MKWTQERLRRLNSMTKYPSIPTYHEMGEKGRLKEGAPPDYDPDARLVVYEKIDGTNARIVWAHDRYFLGSREELLYAQGDLMEPVTMGIVAAVKPIAERLRFDYNQGAVVALYGEVYGHKVGGASKQYAGSSTAVGFCAFDILVVIGWQDLLEQSAEEVAAWRDDGGQDFHDVDAFTKFCAKNEIKMAPHLAHVKMGEIGERLQDAHAFLSCFEETSCVLADGAGRKAEGVIVRTKDREYIAKLRHEDYAKSLRDKEK